MTAEIMADKDRVSRRSVLAALFAGAAVATFVVVEPSDVEAQERQFTGLHHEPRHSRPRSPSRGRRRHRRVARVHRRGKPRPRNPEAPAQ
jgi:hypothetical protein